MENKIIIISGPTASGKSSLALEFAKHRDISIINADSLQIYEGLPILSSQPSADDLLQVRHRLYSFLKPSQNSSVGLWLRLVKNEIEESWKLGKLPVIVGGSGMYISKLVDGISEIPEIDEHLKEGARELFETMGADYFKEELILAGESEEKVLKLDKQRLIRSYEVVKHTGKTMSWWQTQPKKKLFDEAMFTHVNLNPDRETLYDNCNMRFELMLKNGAIEEVEALLGQHSLSDSLITKTLGFAEIIDFLDEKMTYEEAIAISSQKTRNYAKRQLTWFRNQFPHKNVFSNSLEALDFLKNL